MSEIPPDISSSAAQAGFQARETAKERDARRAGQAEAANRQAKSVTEAGDTVETTDADVAVFADAEGTGSQGRPFEEAETGEQETAGGADEKNGITKGDDGQLHVDLEA
ncbi:MAG: hypothetical protein WBE26_14470 [Phycisphaerae bacterium]